MTITDKQITAGGQGGKQKARQGARKGAGAHAEG